MSLMIIEKPGVYSTVQDLGRYGHQASGVPVGGAMDPYAHRIANALVGNPEDAATLECTLTGPTVRFTHNTLVALTGARFQVRVDGYHLPMDCAVMVRAGATLEVGRRLRGARLYLAVGGGFGTTPVLGSRSTYVRGGFGGFEGRALRSGDRVPVLKAPGPMLRLERLLVQSGLPLTAAANVMAAWAPAVPADQAPRPIRFLRGPQWRCFGMPARLSLSSAPYTVHVDSDRMGYRLHGDQLKLKQPLEMVSEAVDAGTVQVPPSGQPIVLMADRQTAGGYPKMAYVAGVDLPLLAQALPGDVLRFAPVSRLAAERLCREAEACLERLALDARGALR